jgi:hypothetical protein
VDNFMQSATIAVVQPFELWGAFTTLVDPALNAGFIESSSPLATLRPHWSEAGGTDMLIYAGVTDLTLPKALAGSNILGARFSGSASFARTNGVQTATANAGSGNLGTTVFYGKAADTAAYLDQSLIGVVIVSGALSTDEQEKLEGYFAHAGGITDALPIGHPYKSEPPTQ